MRSRNTNNTSFLEESRNTDLIRWSDDGDSFIILDEDEFARTLIPELFKHNKYASFVRQLNMYGFHKKVGLSDNSMRASERKNKNPSEYSHPFFKRGRKNLLWLIIKPKAPSGKSSGKSRGNKQEEYDEEVDETFGREDTPMASGQDRLEGNTNFRQQPLLTMGNLGDPLPENELSTLRQEVREVQQNQMAIREMLKQIRQEHQQLYGQAKAFHELHEKHDKHDTSINAILSFLATVYNKNLAAGQSGAGEMFPGAIPSSEQPRGNVVDIGDENQSTPQPFRRPQLLLEAGHPSPTSPATTRSSQPSRQVNSSNSTTPFYTNNNIQATSPNIQELSDTALTPSNRSSQSPQVRPADASPTDNNTPTTNGRQIPEADILRMMNNASSNSHGPGGTNTNATLRMDFPEALTHLQNSDGGSALTPHQRQNVLQLMGNDLSSASTPPNNQLQQQSRALTPPNFNNTINNNNTNPYLSNPLASLDRSSDELTALERALREQDASIAALNSNLAPLSPSGSIPGIGATHPSPGDFSWAMNDDAFASGSDPGYFNDAGLQFDNDFTNLDPGAADFDFSLPGDGEMEGVSNNAGGGVETVGGGSTASAALNVAGDGEVEEVGSPGKKRRVRG